MYQEKREKVNIMMMLSIVDELAKA